MSVTRPLLDAASRAEHAGGVVGTRASILTVAIVATLAAGGGAGASWGQDPAVADASTEIAVETTIPVMDLPNGCAGDDWGEGSID
jgi:hypothetical protein